LKSGFTNKNIVRTPNDYQAWGTLRSNPLRSGGAVALQPFSPPEFFSTSRRSKITKMSSRRTDRKAAGVLTPTGVYMQCQFLLFLMRSSGFSFVCKQV
jgi:hypothetical protein